MLFKMVLFLTSVLIKSYSVSFEIKAFEQYFPVAILIMLNKVVLTIVK